MAVSNLTFSVTIQYEHDSDKAICPIKLGERLVNAVERERQESALTPNDISANWVTVEPQQEYDLSSSYLVCGHLHGEGDDTCSAAAAESQQAVDKFDAQQRTPGHLNDGRELYLTDVNKLVTAIEKRDL